MQQRIVVGSKLFLEVQPSTHIVSTWFWLGDTWIIHHGSISIVHLKVSAEVTIGSLRYRAGLHIRLNLVQDEPHAAASECCIATGTFHRPVISSADGASCQRSKELTWNSIVMQRRSVTTEGIIWEGVTHVKLYSVVMVHDLFNLIVARGQQMISKSWANQNRARHYWFVRAAQSQRFVL